MEHDSFSHALSRCTARRYQIYSQESAAFSKYNTWQSLLEPSSKRELFWPMIRKTKADRTTVHYVYSSVGI